MMTNPSSPLPLPSTRLSSWRGGRRPSALTMLASNPSVLMKERRSLSISSELPRGSNRRYWIRRIRKSSHQIDARANDIERDGPTSLTVLMPVENARRYGIWQRVPCPVVAECNKVFNALVLVGSAEEALCQFYLRVRLVPGRNVGCVAPFRKALLRRAGTPGQRSGFVGPCHSRSIPVVVQDSAVATLFFGGFLHVGFQLLLRSVPLLLLRVERFPHHRKVSSSDHRCHRYRGALVNR